MSLPRQVKSRGIRTARYLSIAIAAGSGCLGALLLGAPAENLLAVFIDLGELFTALLGALIVVSVLVGPAAWLTYNETES